MGRLLAISTKKLFKTSSMYLDLQREVLLLGWQQSHFVFFFMIFKANLLIQITNINQLYVLTILFDDLLPLFFVFPFRWF